MTNGEKIKFYREKLGLSIAELAKKCNISEISIRKYESNERNPKVETLIKLARVLKISPGEFFGYLDDPIEVSIANTAYDNSQQMILESIEAYFTIKDLMNKIVSTNLFSEEFNLENKNLSESQLKNLSELIYNYINFCCKNL